MNKEYTYMDGKVVVKNEKGVNSLIEYQDNIEEILIKENLIEIMEEKQKKLINDIEISEKNKVSKGWKYFSTFLPVIAGIILPPLFNLSFGLSYLNCSILDTIKLTLIEMVSLSAILTPLSMRKLGVYEQAEKHEKGLISQLYFLESQMEKEKESLQKLKENKTQNKCNNFETTKVNDKEVSKKLSNTLDAYYDFGYNEEKYSQYYQDGILEKKLSKFYNEAEIGCAKKYIEDKGRVLVKTK